MFNVYLLTTAGDISNDQISLLIFSSLKDVNTLLHMDNFSIVKQQNFSIKKLFRVASFHKLGVVCGFFLGYIDQLCKSKSCFD